jgi:hypothetical protein
MKSSTLLLPVLCQTLLAAALTLTARAADSSNIRAIYLFKDVLKSNTTALTTSGFNTLIIFGIGVLSNGGIMYYSNTPGSKDTLVASNGTYVGGDALAAKVRSFKTTITTNPNNNNTTTSSNTEITRLEISMNAQNIRPLLTTPGPGTGPTTPLHRNFAALKTAWSLDAVNNDDESIYDTASTVAFAKMLGQIGYRYSIAPYTVPSFWAGVVAGVNRGRKAGDPDGGLLLDRVYLQCYDGGAGNVPSEWARRLGMGVVPLVWVVNDSKPRFGVSVEQARGGFEGWKRAGGVVGGGYWNDYDVEKMGLSYGYGGVLESVFP